MRIDLFISHEIPELSRTEVQRQIRSGAVRVNGRTIDTPSANVNSGDLVEFDMPGSSLSDAIPVPQNLDFRVAYDDEHIIVVDKPAGMSVHAGAGRKDGTLVNGLLARYPELADLEPVERPWDCASFGCGYFWFDGGGSDIGICFCPICCDQDA